MQYHKPLKTHAACPLLFEDLSTKFANSGRIQGMDLLYKPGKQKVLGRRQQSSREGNTKTKVIKRKKEKEQESFMYVGKTGGLKEKKSKKWLKLIEPENGQY